MRTNSVSTELLAHSVLHLHASFLSLFLVPNVSKPHTLPWSIQTCCSWTTTEVTLKAWFTICHNIVFAFLNSNKLEVEAASPYCA